MRKSHFYPRSPRGERRGLVPSHRCVRRFLSTLPARGATIRRSGGYIAGQFLSTLPARGATEMTGCNGQHRAISIHAPREGSDFGRRLFAVRCIISIHAPREGSDLLSLPPACPAPISIHAPREGSDGGHGYPRPRRPAISIHAPREGSDLVVVRRAHVQAISIHAPREGSDDPSELFEGQLRISIHAPREGSDVVGCIVVNL